VSGFKDRPFAPGGALGGLYLMKQIAPCDTCGGRTFRIFIMVEQQDFCPKCHEQQPVALCSCGARMCLNLKCLPPVLGGKQ
jgi:hypothetical protein